MTGSPSDMGELHIQTILGKERSPPVQPIRARMCSSDPGVATFSGRRAG